MSTAGVATTSENTPDTGTTIHNSINCMRITPSILPEAYDGEAEWGEWIAHFDCVARINSWDDEMRLLWLQVRMTGKARRAWERFTAEAKLSYQTAVSCLCEQFEPSCHRDLHGNKFRTMGKNKGETWADFADRLRNSADLAFPELGNMAKERITVDRFLGSLDNPTVALFVRQKHPTTLNEASQYTCKIETILSLMLTGANDMNASSINNTTHEMHETALPELEARIKAPEQLEKQLSHGQSRATVTRRKCRQVGHFARAGVCN